ncbi:ribonuclease HI [Hathewaya proteolytica DSM 3090]|uniref:ribonuclease H n=1 Tax=Hathewaya proteolytica DSM 3090 TaxID=1121331 RepID=A0A1M6QK15_9CLOT|nr:ribonuclease H family protein [Hathewaya proteolytica]SHK20614.1 ribonuclease HI [Hathewaya proteolytica DSM 3090]
MAQKKYYAVKCGRKTGVFNTWDECKSQVSGYSGAIYKSFTTYGEAEDFIMGSSSEDNDTYESNDLKETSKSCREMQEGCVEAYVDGSYSNEYGNYSYGCVILEGSEIIRLSGVGDNEEYISMRNVAGELLGTMRAIQWAKENNCKAIMIYHDYEGIARWADGSWKTNKDGTRSYAKFIQEHREFLKINFTKVLAHSGVEYNEEADRLAKKALAESKR